VNDTDGGLRIGELARRTGVSPDLLRAWEQRYDLLRPARSPGGFRLYSREDEARIRRMTELIKNEPRLTATTIAGLSEAEATLSAYRLAVHRLLDAATGELIRRYQTDPTACLDILPDAGPASASPRRAATG